MEEHKTRSTIQKKKNNTELKPLRVGARRTLEDDAFLMKALAVCTTQSVVHLEIGVPVECTGLAETCTYHDKDDAEYHYSNHIHWAYFTAYMGLGVVYALQRDRAEAYTRTEGLWEWYEFKVPKRNLDDCVQFLEHQLGKPYHPLSCWYPLRLLFGQSYPWRTQRLSEVAETLSSGPPLNVPGQPQWNCVELVYSALIAAGILELGSDVPPVHTATAANVIDALKRLYGGDRAMRGMLANEFKRTSEADDMEYYAQEFTLL